MQVCHHYFHYTGTMPYASMSLLFLLDRHKTLCKYVITIFIDRHKALCKYVVTLLTKQAQNLMQV